MCNINLLIKRNEKNSRELLNILNVISAISFTDNSDADGCLFLDAKGSRTIEKSTKKLVYKKPAYAYFSHQRFATGGENEDFNAHPFETPHHVIIHNGVFQNYHDLKYSDTYLFAEEFNDRYEKTKDTVQTIKDILTYERGRYSLVIYDKTTGQTYYVKNTTTEFYVSVNDEYIVASTLKDNVELAIEELDIEEPIWTPTAHTIYDLMTWEEVGKVKPPRYTCSSTTSIYDEWDWWEEEERTYQEHKQTQMEMELMELAEEQNRKAFKDFSGYNNDKWTKDSNYPKKEHDIQYYIN